MASRKRPNRLRPVASPTDNFVAPAIGGVDPTQFNFGALGQLSSSLARYAEFEQRLKLRREAEDRQKKALAKQEASEAASKLAALEAQDPSLRGRFVYTKAEDVPEEQWAFLKEQGIEYEDSPQFRLEFAHQRVRRSVSDNGWREKLNDPELIRRMASVSLEPNGSAKVQEMIGRVREDFLREHYLDADSLPPHLNASVVQEMAAIEEEFRPKVAAAATAWKEEEQSLNDVEAVVSGLHKSIAASTSSDPLILTKEITGLKYQQEQEIQKGATPSKVKKRFDTAARAAIETMARDLLKKGDKEDIDSLRAFIDEASKEKLFGNPNLVNDLHGTLDAMVARKEADEQNNLPLARAELDGEVQALLDGGMTVQQIMDPKNAEGFAGIIENLAEKHNVSAVALNGQKKRVQDMLLAYTNDRETARWTHALESQAQAAIASGDQKALDSVLALAPFQEQARLRRQFEENGPFNNPVAKEYRSGDKKGIIGSLGSIANDELVVGAVSEIRSAYDAAQRAHLREKPEDFAGSSMAGIAAARATEGYQTLKRLRVQESPDYWVTEKLPGWSAEVYKGFEEDLRLEQSDPSIGPEQQKAKSRQHRAKMEFYKLAEEAEINRLISEPAWAELTSTSARERYLRNGLRRVRDDLERTALAGSIGDVSPQVRERNAEARGARMAKLPEVRELPSLTGGRIAPAGWVPRDQWAQTMLGVRGMLTKHWSAETLTTGDWRSMSDHITDFEDMVVAALARAEGAQIPRGDLRNNAGFMYGQLRDSIGGKNTLQGLLDLRGLTVSEIEAGEFAGRDLTDIYGKDFFSEFPASRVALFSSLEEFDAAAENPEEGEMARIVKALKLEEPKVYEAFVAAQRDLLIRRGADEAGTTPPAQTRTSSGVILQGLPGSSVYSGAAFYKRIRAPFKIRVGEPSWSTRYKSRMTND